MRLFVDEAEVKTRLEQMGLTLEGLVRVLLAAGGGWNGTTAFHPSSGPGTYLYQEGTAAFRRLVMPLGEWDYDESDNQPRTFNEARNITVVVQTGDEYTGIDGTRHPTTRHPKGTATQRKVALNGQMELFQRATVELPEMATYCWFFLMAVVGNELRGELSLPEAMRGDSRPYNWVERILLPVQNLGGSGPIDVTRPGDSGPNIDFDVAWRQ